MHPIDPPYDQTAQGGGTVVPGGADTHAESETKTLRSAFSLAATAVTITWTSLVSGGLVTLRGP